jgi:hypothetical protein
MLKFNPPTWPIKPPRRWQPEAMGAVAQHFAASTEPGVVVAIMGAGKSMLIQELCATVRLADNQVVVISTSTQRLVEDIHAAVKERLVDGAAGIWYGKRKRMAQYVVACVDSLQGLADKLKEQGKTVALWIADECHQTESPTVLAAHQCLQPLHALGLTATAFRSDKYESITLFKKMLYKYGVREALADGNVVVPWRIVNYEGENSDLDAACLEMIRGASGPGLANASSIEDANAFAKYLSNNGLPAKSIHSKQTSRVQSGILNDLKTGVLRVVVHVNLLTEGSNYPWLRWLLLRREVDARVRFAQEVGRVLRTDDGKTEAVIYDPHDLFGTFHLTYAEALGEPPIRPEWESEDLTPADRAERIASSEPPVAMAFVESAVRTLVVACECARMMGSRKMIKKADRLKPATPLQIVATGNAIAGVVGIAPDGWMQCLSAIAHRPAILRFGFISDLLNALDGIKRAKAWPSLDAGGRISGSPCAEEPYPMVMDETGQGRVDFSKLGDE